MDLTPDRKAAYQTLERRWEQLGIESLSKDERRFIALEALAGDTLNGGLDQYFYNSSGDTALLAIEALDILGEQDAREALDSAIGKLWPDGYPTDRSGRYDVITDVEDEQLLDLESRVICEASQQFMPAWLDRLADFYGDQSVP